MSLLEMADLALDDLSSLADSPVVDALADTGSETARLLFNSSL